MSQRDPELSGDCLKLAVNLQRIIINNQTRVNAELFASFRQGTVRQIILEKNLTQAIGALSQGDLDQAKIIIKDTMSQLGEFKGGSYFSESVPELKALEKLYKNIDSQVDNETQMSVGKTS